MPRWGPTKRRVLIAGLRRLGFQGPFSGGKHEFMVRRDLVLTIPNPHKGDISPELLGILLRQAGITRKEWEAPSHQVASSSTSMREVEPPYGRITSLDDGRGGWPARLARFTAGTSLAAWARERMYA